MICRYSHKIPHLGYCLLFFIEDICIIRIRQNFLFVEKLGLYYTNDNIPFAK
jgi:hypothetical protein